MDKGIRCQASLEIIIIMGIVLTLFVVIGYVIYGNYVKGKDLEIYINGQRLANHIADNINTINAVPDGHSSHFTVPNRLFGDREYIISFFKNESSAFVEGNAYTSGRESLYSSPITTHDINCLLDECYHRCNKTAQEQCINVNDTMVIRLVKYNDGVYLTPEYNVIQGDTREYIVPFEGESDFGLSNLTSFVTDFGKEWNVVHLYRNTRNNTLSLVISMNLTDHEKAKMDFKNIVGDIVSTKAHDEWEMTLTPGIGEPNGNWEINETTTPPMTSEVSGGIINFKKGVHICLNPRSGYFPSGQWEILSSDGNNVNIANQKEVCITYP